MLEDYLPVLLQALLAGGFAGVTLLISVLLGKSAARTKMKDSAYECGMLPIGEAQPRFSVKFYLVAILFVLITIPQARFVDRLIERDNARMRAGG